ncbi:MAG: metallophosphoesterase, partial [Calditrichaeota bacterium]|nr:metallophosphoesterase [Calditrichota bacterium]
MKILHTADVHIREKDDERWQALAHLLELGKAHQINVLVIAGDLFDSP